jgi:NAD(P)-dependent dehydrogenase (short-subunit alcohol dehydrogenase family)
MGLLDKKVVLITGTGGGLGRVAAQTFAREGAKVVGCDIKVDANNETVELIGRAGGEMTGIAPIDLTDPEQARKMVEDAVAAYGGLDVVYNNAAIQYFGPMPDFSMGFFAQRPEKVQSKITGWELVTTSGSIHPPHACR